MMRHPKQFIRVSVLLMLLALLAVVYVWFLIQPNESETMFDGENLTPEGESTYQPSETVQNIGSRPDEGSVSTTERAAEGIPLRDLPLSDTQISLAESFGIEVDTFTITPIMQQCAENALGADRLGEIIAGDSPGVVETFSLVRCISP